MIQTNNFDFNTTADNSDLPLTHSSEEAATKLLCKPIDMINRDNENLN